MWREDGRRCSGAFATKKKKQKRKRQRFARNSSPKRLLNRARVCCVVLGATRAFGEAKTRPVEIGVAHVRRDFLAHS